jgi:hypothetical protein
MDASQKAATETGIILSVKRWILVFMDSSEQGKVVRGSGRIAASGASIDEKDRHGIRK